MTAIGQETSSIACENCRTKKCKCDRTLPACAQCRATSVVCEYPQRGKRGIPAGYVSSLEKRLAETEAALYVILMRFVSDVYPAKSSSVDELSHRYAMRLCDHNDAQSRQDKLTQWSSLPLDSMRNLEHWRTKMENVLIRDTSATSWPNSTMPVAATKSDNTQISSLGSVQTVELSPDGEAPSSTAPGMHANLEPMARAHDFSFDSTMQTAGINYNFESPQTLQTTPHVNVAERLSQAERMKYF